MYGCRLKVTKIVVLKLKICNKGKYLMVNHLILANVFLFPGNDIITRCNVTFANEEIISYHIEILHCFSVYSIESF